MLNSSILNPEWAAKISGNGENVFCSSIFSDNNGNNYLSGYYNSDPVTFYKLHGTPSTVGPNNDGTLPNQDPLPNQNPSFSGFIAKINSVGEWQWAIEIAGAGFNEMTLVTGENDHIYLTGYYVDEVTFYQLDGTPSTIGPNSDGTLPNSGGNDSFIAKIDSNGIWQWVARIAGGGDDRATSVSVENGQIYITGNYNNELTIYNENGTASDIGPNSDGIISFDGGYNGFVIKYSVPIELFPVVLLSCGVSGDTLQYYHASGEYLDVFSGLIPGAKYYWNYETGQLTTNKRVVTPYVFIGTAVSDTRMIVRPQTIVDLN